MNIIEVKNNLVKLCYEDDLKLAGLLLIQDSVKSYIAQVLHLETTRIGKVAIAKILFNYADKIYAYDGSIPSLRAQITPLDTTFLLDTLEHTNPLTIGKIAGQKDNIIVDFNILNDNPIVLAEKFFATKVLLNNIAIQLQGRKKKILVFDTTGVFKGNKLTVTKDFKLPLNSSTINYIYEREFEDATAESKSLIQNIFEELSEYSKTVDFIPFDTFKSVVDAEFMRTKLIQLIVMKNKIKQIRDRNIFAQTPDEFDILQQKIMHDDTVVLDISCLKPSLQQECIRYVYSILAEINSEIYVFTPLANDGTDKFLLSEILNTENIHTTIICDYDYPLLNELKKRSKNMFMFTPLKQQKDFGSYNIFLQKLAEDEFIAYGKMSKFVPIIGKLTQISTNDFFVPKTEETNNVTVPVQTQEIPVVDTSVREEIIQNPAPAEEVAFTEEVQVAEEVQVPEEIQEIIPENETTEEQISTDAPEETAETEETAENTATDENVVAEQEENPATETADENAEETETVPTEEIVPEAEAAEPTEGNNSDTTPDETVETVSEDEGVEPVPAETNEVQEALNEVEDVEDEEELSDDDLDMIEKLSKPNEEIPVLNEGENPQAILEEQPAETAPAEEVARPEETNQNVDEEIQKATIPQQAEPLQTRANTNPAVPEYSAEIPDEDKVNSDILQQGDRVMHEEFGEGVVEKMINYGDKILCSVNFATVGRRLLNPEISEMKKI